MSDFIIRKATIKDVPFLVETIIQAEKSGTDKLSYSTIFGLTEEEVRKYIAKMLLEEVDGCELSISSFIIAEKDGITAAATGAWIEGVSGIPSTILKGNLLSYTLPKLCFEKALSVNNIIREVYIEYIQDTMQLGLVYVSSSFRGMNLVSILIDEHINQLHIIKPNIRVIYVQVFGNNTPAIKAYQKAHFNVIMLKQSSNNEIIHYLPANNKVLMKREI